MIEADEKLLEDAGWDVECKSPFEIRMKSDPESFATNQAAEMILGILKRRGKHRR